MEQRQRCSYFLLGGITLATTRIMPLHVGKGRTESRAIVENPKPHGKSYGQWLGDQAKRFHLELLRIALDKALAKRPADLEALWQRLQSGRRGIIWRR